MTPKTAMILGCHGQDGSLLSHSLLKKGHKVIGLSRNNGGTSKNHKILGIEKDIELIKCDITNYKDLEKIFKKIEPNTIYNLAAQSSVGRSFINPVETFESIITGTINILEITKDLKFTGQIFFAGSSEIFGDIDYKANINHLQKPNSPYGIAKQTSFNLVKLYRESFKLNCKTGILFNHESHLREETFVTQKIIKSAQKIFERKQSCLKIGNIDIVRDWGWAPEYVEAMQLIAESDKLKDHIICTGKAVSLKTFIQKVFAKYDLDWKNFVQVDEKYLRKNEIMRSCGDPSQLDKDLNWSAKVDIDKMIEKLITK